MFTFASSQKYLEQKRNVPHLWNLQSAFLQTLATENEIPPSTEYTGQRLLLYLKIHIWKWNCKLLQSCICRYHSKEIFRNQTWKNLQQSFSGYSLSFLICFAEVLKEPLVSVVMATLNYLMVLFWLYTVYIYNIYFLFDYGRGDCGKRILSSLRRHLIEVSYSC